MSIADKEKQLLELQRERLENGTLTSATESYRTTSTQASSGSSIAEKEKQLNNMLSGLASDGSLRNIVYSNNYGKGFAEAEERYNGFVSRLESYLNDYGKDYGKNKSNRSMFARSLQDIDGISADIRKMLDELDDYDLYDETKSSFKDALNELLKAADSASLDARSVMAAYNNPATQRIMQGYDEAAYSDTKWNAVKESPQMQMYNALLDDMGGEEMGGSDNASKMLAQNTYGPIFWQYESNPIRQNQMLDLLAERYGSMANQMPRGSENRVEYLQRATDAQNTKAQLQAQRDAERDEKIMAEVERLKGISTDTAISSVKQTIDELDAQAQSMKKYWDEQAYLNDDSGAAPDYAEYEKLLEERAKYESILDDLYNDNDSEEMSGYTWADDSIVRSHLSENYNAANLYDRVNKAYFDTTVDFGVEYTPNRGVKTSSYPIAQRPENYMTQEERDTFNKLWHYKSEEAAMAYFERLTPTLEARGAQQVTAEAKQFTEDYPNWAWVQARGANAMKPISSAFMVGDILGGEGVRENSAANMNTQVANFVDSYTPEVTNYTGNAKILGRDLDRFLYGTVGSTVDSAVRMFTASLIGGAGAGASAVENAKGIARASNALMSLEVFPTAVLQEKEKGRSDSEAVVLGALRAAIEGFTERYSVELLLSPSKNFGELLLKGAFAEGSEEIAATVLNGAVDIIAADKDNIIKEWERRTALGIDSIEALADIIYERGKSTLADGLSGALSGLMFSAGGGISGAMTPTTKSAERMAQSVEVTEALVKQALAENPNNRVALKAQEDLAAGKTISAKTVQKLIESNESVYRKDDQQTIASFVASELTNRGEVTAVNETANAIAKAVVGENLSDGDLRAIENSVFGKQLYNEVTGQTKGGEWLNQLRDNLDVVEIARPQIQRETKPTAAKRVTVKNADATTKDGTAVQIVGLEAQTDGTTKVKVKGSDGAVKAMAASELELNEISADLIEGVAKFKGAAPAIYAAYMPTNDVGTYLNDVEYIVTAANGVAADNDGSTVLKYLMNSKHISDLADVQIKTIFNAALEEGRKALAESQPLSTSGSGQFTYTAKRAESSLSGREAAATVFMQNLAKVAPNIDIEVFESTSRNGKYIGEQGSYSNGKIRIDLNAGKNFTYDVAESAMLRTLSHELTHHLQRTAPKQYAALKAFVTKHLAEWNGGTELDDLISAKQRRSGGKLSYAAALDEVVADSCEMMLKNSAAVKQLAVENKGLFSKIRDFVKKFLSDLRRAFAGVEANDAAARYLQKFETEMQKLWDEAFTASVQNAKTTAAENAQKNTAPKDDVQHSLRAFEDGTRFVDVQIDQEQFSGLTPEQATQKAKEIIRKKFAQKVIGIDNRVFVNGETASEYAHPRKNIDNNIRLAKMKASAELDNLIDAGMNFRNVPDGLDGHIHPDVVAGFDHFDVIFKIAEEYYKGRINVKNIKRGRLLKDVTQIENITKDIISSYGTNPKSEFLRDVSMDSIYTADAKSQEQNSDTEQYSERDHIATRDSLGNELSEQQQKFFAKSKAVDRNGKLVLLYHGTTNGGFTVFDSQFSDDKLSLFAADNLNMAFTYSGSKDVLNLPKGKPAALRWTEGSGTKGKGQVGVYQVYYNLTNPLIIDGHGENWDNLSVGEHDVVSFRVSQASGGSMYGDVPVVVEITTNGRTRTTSFSSVSEMRSELTSKYNSSVASAVASKTMRSVQSGNEVTHKIHWSNETHKEVPTMTTRDLAKKAKAEGYDGLIVRNIIDSGKYGKRTDSERGTIYVAFDSNQIKSVDNKNPTAHKDIRYSDRDYFAAIERGDMETVQRMYDETANEAGFDTIAYHGTNQGDFFVFDWDKTQRADGGFYGRGHYFSKSKGMADQYGSRVIRARLKLGKTFVWENEVNTYQGKRPPEIFSRNIVSRINLAKHFPGLFANRAMYYWDFDAKKGDYVEKSIKWSELDGIVNELAKDLILREYANGTYRWHTQGKFWEVPVGEEFKSVEEANDGKFFAAINALKEKYDGAFSSMTFDDQTSYTQDHGTEITEILKSKGYNSAMDTAEGGEIVVFDSSQIKSADPVTYDNKGDVIPLSERFNAENNDIRYSDRDSDNRKLTEAQREYFKDTKVRDHKGRLKVMYHGSKNQFTVFDRAALSDRFGFFFTEDKYEASEYGTPTEYYLNISNPFDMYGDVPIGEFLGGAPRYVNGEFNYDAAVKGLIDAGYDGVASYSHGTQWYIAFSPEQIKRTDNTNPTSDPDTRYSERDYEAAEIALLEQRIAALEQGKSDAFLAGQMRTARQAGKETRRLTEKIDTLKGRLEEAKQTAKDTKKATAEDRKAANLRAKNLEAQIKKLTKEAEASGFLAGEMSVARQAGAEIRSREDQIRKLKAELADRKAAYSANLAKFREGRDTGTYRERVVKRIRNLQDMLITNSDKKHIPEMLKEPLGNFLLALDTSSATKLKGKGETKGDADMYRRAVQLQKALERARNNTEEGGYLDLPDEFMDEFDLMLEQFNNLTDSGVEGIADAPINQMNSKQLQYLNFVLRTLQHSINSMNKMLATARFQTVAQAAESTISELDKIREYQIKKGLEWLRSAAAWKNATPVYAFDRMGEAGKELFKAMWDAQGDFAFSTQELLDFRNSVVDNKQVRKWSSDVQTIELSDNRTVRMTTAQMMAFYCLAQRQQALEHLKTGGMRVANIGYGKNPIQQARAYHLSVEDITKIAGMVKGEAKTVADKIQRYMTERGSEWGNEISMARFGYRAFTEPVYFPIRTESSQIAKDTKSTQENSINRLLNMGFTKAVQPNAKTCVVVDNIFDIFSAHMSDMAKYHAFALPVLDMIKWYDYSVQDVLEDGVQRGHRAVKTSIESAYGKDALQYISTFLEDVNGANEGGRIRSAKLSQKFISHYKASAVGANLRVAIQQPTSYWRAAAVLDPKYLAIGEKVMWHNAHKIQKELNQYTGIAIWKELGFRDFNVGRNIRDQISGTLSASAIVYDKVMDASMKLAAAGDTWTWCRLWEACKAEVKATKKLSGEALLNATAERFNDVIARTQVVDSVMTRSHTMRSTHPLDQFMTPFMAEPTLSYNVVSSTVFDYATETRRSNRQTAWKKYSGKMARAFGVFTVTALWTGVFQSLADAFRDDDDYEEFYKKFLDALLPKGLPSGKFSDDPKKWIEDALDQGNFLSNMNIVNNIPGLHRELLNVLKGFGSEAMWSAGIENFYKACLAIYEKHALDTGKTEEATDVTYNGNMTWWGAIQKALQSASQISGLPIYNLTRDATALFNTTVQEFFGRQDIKILTYDPGTEGRVANAYADGFLTFDEAMAEMQKFDIASDVAYEKLMKAAGFKKYDALKDAIANGGDVKAVMDELIGYGIKEDLVESNVKSAIKDLCMGTEDTPPSIDKKTAKNMLVEYLGMSFPEAHYAVEAYGEDNFSKYDDIRDAILNGGDVQAAMDELVEYGTSESDVLSEIRSSIKLWYQGETKDDGTVVDPVIDKERAIELLVQYGDRDEEEATELVTGWSLTVDTGMKDDDVKTAFLNDELSTDEAIEIRMNYYGQTEEEAAQTLSEWMFEDEYGYSYGEVGKEFKDGNLSADELLNIQMEYGGKKEKDAKASVAGYTKDAYKEGTLSWSEAEAILTNQGGMTKEAAQKFRETADFEDSHGWAYGDLGDLYRDGEISQSEAKSALTGFGGKTSAEADDAIAVWDYQKSNPNTSLDSDQIKQYLRPIDALGYSAKDAGISDSVFYTYKNNTKGLSGIDADGDGKADRDSKKNQILPVIDSLPISNDQKDALYYLNGWAASKIWSAPWH